MMTCMRQVNLNVTPEFDRDLRRFMKLRGISQKSVAIRQAVREAVTRGSDRAGCDYRTWLGLGLKAPLNPKPRFEDEDAL